MAKRQYRELEQQCYHEAGQAVVAFILGVNVTEITTNNIYAMVAGLDDKEIALTRMTIMVAGLVAEQIKYRGASWLISAVHDYEQVETLAKEAGIFYQEKGLEKRARAILTQHWNQVERIATALNASPTGKLEGFEWQESSPYGAPSCADSTFAGQII